MTYRERRLRRAERLREWAAKRNAQANAAGARAHEILDVIPMGQPILVGHHSERGHRRDLDRAHNAISRSVESTQMARRHAARADEIERQAEHAIYSDDPDAIERLRERIADLEARRARMKAVNAALRKGCVEKLDPPLTDAERGELQALARIWGNVYKPGFPSYALQNLTGNINRQRKRLAALNRKETP